MARAFQRQELRNAVAQESRSFREIVAKALDMIEDGMIVGLGSGRAATAFVEGLGERVRAGLAIRGVPTSEATGTLARRLTIPLTTLDENVNIDVDVDGADEVDPQLNLIKGYGGALVREKIVAAAARRLIILVGPEKIVPVLGTRGRLPVEVIPFGVGPCRDRLTKMGYPSALRRKGEDLVITDNGNYILDCQVSTIANPTELDQTLLQIPGVVGTGLFVGMADTVLIQGENGAEVRQGKKD
jgi:ribose 5-phosphate isomerase A